MKTIRVDFTTTQGYTVTGAFKDDATKLVENIKAHIALGTTMYIGNGKYINAQHIFTFRMIQQ